MGAKRTAFLYALVFAGLLAFHLWLLWRMIAARNPLLSSLLAVAVTLFAWRIVHYGSRVRTGPLTPRNVDPREEMRRIRVYAPVLVALLGLHGWLISVTLTAGEIAFVALLVVAVIVFALRLALYTRRWISLRRRSTEGAV